MNPWDIVPSTKALANVYGSCIPQSTCLFLAPVSECYFPLALSLLVGCNEGDFLRDRNESPPALDSWED